MKKTILFPVVIVTLLLGISFLNAGGNYGMQPNSKAIAVDTPKAEEKDTPSSQYKGTHRMSKLRKFKRNSHLGIRFVRMQRKHFIR